MVEEKILLCFRRVKLLACIKQRKQLRRLWKLLKLGEELSDAVIKPGRIVVNHHLPGRNVVGTAMFNHEIKSISTSTMQRAVKGLGLNSCVAS